MKQPFLRFVLCGFISWIASVSLFAADTDELVRAWLGAQTNIQTWSADLVQTRTFKSLTRPLTEKGHIFFAAPNRFRWELGNPAQTIAVRSGDEMLVFYPRLKRVERYPLGGDQTGPWGDALALLEAGFPRSRTELESRLRIVSHQVSDKTCEVVLQPRSAAARKMMPQIKIMFDTGNFMLKATELEFADGSTMRNDFTNPILNSKLDDAIFSTKIPPDYKIIEPLKQASSSRSGGR
jgi:outer membrane lipoprotein-sorting protein